MNTPRVRTAGLLAAVAVMGLALGGCSGDDDGVNPNASPSSSPVAKSESPESGQEPGPESATAAPDSTQELPSWGDDFTGILSDVEVTECPTAKGNVRASGNVINRADGARDILISVVWLREDSGDTLDKDFVVLADVPAGGVKTWKVNGTLSEAAGQCVLGAKANRVGTADGETSPAG